MSFGIASAVLMVFPALSSQGYASAEYRSKANFLVRFLDFVEWPETSFPSSQAPFVVCVRGDFLFGTSLAEIARGSSPQGKRVDVLWLRDDQKLRSCHILFVSRSESKRYTKILQAVAGGDVLTIGETPDFLDAGGAMSFTEQPEAGGSQLQFEVNLLAANSAHLRISSKLLAVARRVVKSPEDRKS